MRVRDGPAAVRGVAPRHEATGQSPGRRRRREPRVRRPAGRPPYRTPRGRRIRGQAPHPRCRPLPRCCPRRRSRQPSTCASKARRRHLFGPTEVTVNAANALEAIAAGLAARRALLPRHAVELRPRTSTRSASTAAPPSSGWVFKVDNASPPVGADQVTLKDGDTVLWYYADFGPTGGPPTLEVKAASKQGLLHGDGLRRQRQAGVGQRPHVARRLEEDRARHDRRGVLPGQAHRPARPRDRDRRGPVERSGVRRAARPRVRARPRRLRRERARARDGDAVGDARPRRARRLRGLGARRARRRSQAVERELKVTTRYGGRYLQSIDGLSGSLGTQRDWFYCVNGVEGDRSAADVTAPRRRRRSGGTTATGRARRCSIPVVVGAYPQPFLARADDGVSRPGRALARAIARAGARRRQRARRRLAQLHRRSAGKLARERRHDRAVPQRRYCSSSASTVAPRLARDPHALRYRL